jgi:hypothetical protein
MSNSQDPKITIDLYQGPVTGVQVSSNIETKPKNKTQLGVLVILAIPFILLFSAFGIILKFLNSFSGKSDL